MSEESKSQRKTPEKRGAPVLERGLPSALTESEGTKPKAFMARPDVTHSDKEAASLMAKEVMIAMGRGETSK